MPSKLPAIVSPPIIWYVNQKAGITGILGFEKHIYMSPLIKNRFNISLFIYMLCPTLTQGTISEDNRCIAFEEKRSYILGIIIRLSLFHFSLLICMDCYNRSNSSDCRSTCPHSYWNRRTCAFSCAVCICRDLFVGGLCRCRVGFPGSNI